MGKSRLHKTGVILMRCQPPHKGHMYLIKQALEECEEVHIFLGSSDKYGTVRNPFPIKLRTQMLDASIYDEIYEEEESRIHIHTLRDLSSEDSDDIIQWGHYLYYNIVAKVGNRSFTIYYSDNPDIMLKWFDAEVAPYITYQFIERSNICEGLSATKIRQAVLNDDNEYLKRYLTETVLLYAGRMKHYLLINREGE